jgi:dTMP kinase
MARGLFITFEGTEGTGKSTQAALLAENLRGEGRRVMITREPGGTRLGEELRRILLGDGFEELDPTAELFIYMADRAQHVAQVILPALDEGKVVICDRFTDATVAYQGEGRGLRREMIESLNAEAALGLVPDLTILLDFEDVAEGLGRAAERNRREGKDGPGDRFEGKEVDFHRRVQQGYRSLAKTDPARYRSLAANLALEDLHAQIMALVREALA